MADSKTSANTANENTLKNVNNTLDASGFPFQTAISKTIGDAEGWQLLAEEYPWQDVDGNTQFLDLLAANGKITIAVECKKTQKEVYTFLNPNKALDSSLTDRVSCIFSEQINDSARQVENFFGIWSIWPESYESMFCVVSTSDKGNNQRMIEGNARLLLQANDYYADFIRRKFKPTDQASEPIRLFLPILVTNAKLFLASYNASEISLDSGQFNDKHQKEIIPIKWIRFRKAFMCDHRIESNPRTVMVVRSVNLVELLASLEIKHHIPDGQTRVVPRKI